MPILDLPQHVRLSGIGRRLCCAILAVATAAFAQTQRLDTKGDALVRRTDPGADGAIDPLTHRLPDVLFYRIGYWTPAQPAVDLFEGDWSSGGQFFRLDIVFDGVMNPPGTLGGGYPYNPFRHGPHPVFGYFELDMDASADTGGELLEPQHRYLGAVARFGGLPSESYYQNRAAHSQSAFDSNLATAPFVDRSGEEFHVAFHGWQILSISKSRPEVEWFEAGDVWIVSGRFFHRAHGYEPFSYACCTGGAGSYEPVVTLRFAHSINEDETTVSLVYPLTNTGSAAMTGSSTVQPPDSNVSNQNSVYEALDDLVFSVQNPRPGWRQNPNFPIVASWEGKNPADYLDPTTWRCNFVVGTGYSSPSAGALYVWTDVGPDVLMADFDGSGSVDATDEALMDAFISANDGTNSDADGTLDGRVQISAFGPNFSRFDLNYDGYVDELDRGLIGGTGPRPADLDMDGDVDQDDFGHFQRCFGLQGLLVGDCAGADLNGDSRVDVVDLVRLLDCRSGPSVPAAAECRD